MTLSLLYSFFWWEIHIILILSFNKILSRKIDGIYDISLHVLGSYIIVRKDSCCLVLYLTTGCDFTYKDFTFVKYMEGLWRLVVYPNI